MDDLYSIDVLSLAANCKHIGRLSAPDASARKVSKLCGSWIEVDVVLEAGRVAEFAMRMQACALAQASAAILAEHIIGANLEELTQVRDALHAMLKENGPEPSGKFEQLKLLRGVAEYPARHTSTMLAFEAIVEAAANAAAI